MNYLPPYKTFIALNAEHCSTFRNEANKAGDHQAATLSSEFFIIYMNEDMRKCQHITHQHNHK
jgi:hypothetical protein